MNIFNEAKELHSYTSIMRRDFHMHPELQHEEVRTAEVIIRELAALGLPMKTKIHSTGITAVLEGCAPGPTVMLRADMDALPVTEANETEYVSLTPGKMHACGHDGHMAVLLSTAKLLQRHQDQIKGKVLFLFQPAEEGGFGAQRMLEAGALEAIKPDYALGLHLWNEMPVGRMVVHGGPLMAGMGMFEVLIRGKGGHGAVPHLSIDPVLAAAEITVALQSIVSRNTNPMEPAVLSVTQILTGTAANIIPADALIRGTIRAFTNEVMDLMIKRFREVVTNIASGMGCEVEIHLDDYISPTVNDPAVADLVAQAIVEELPEVVIDSTHRTMGSEDMSIWLEQAPGCFFFVGSNSSVKGLDYPHHHPRFDIDEDSLTLAVTALTSAALKICS